MNEIFYNFLMVAAAIVATAFLMGTFGTGIDKTFRAPALANSASGNEWVDLAMSRAFIKETDDLAEDLPDPLVSPHPPPLRTPHSRGSALSQHRRPDDRRQSTAGHRQALRQKTPSRRHRTDRQSAHQSLRPPAARAAIRRRCNQAPGPAKSR
jgi:hypothetical protein